MTTGCPICGGTDFEPIGTSTTRDEDLLVCQNCFEAVYPSEMVGGIRRWLLILRWWL